MEIINDNNLEAMLCVWKETLNKNLDGIGTSFSKDYKELTDKQKECYRCVGIKTECERYR